MWESGLGILPAVTNLQGQSENESCSLCNFLALGTQRAAMGLKRSPSKIARPRPSLPNSRAIPSLPWWNALKIVERASSSIPMPVSGISTKIRPVSRGYRDFAAFRGEFGGVFQQIPEGLLKSHNVADHTKLAGRHGERRAKSRPPRVKTSSYLEERKV